MTREIIHDIYYNYLCDMVFPDELDRKRYERLLRTLDNIEFRYSIAMDENRYSDGINLRYRFGYEYEFHQSMIRAMLDISKCSVLEMMVALALRCEEHIMSDPDIGNRITKWFRVMLKSLGLINMTDDNFNRLVVEETINNFLDRRYEPNGRGGLFVINNRTQDMTKVEIWYQMCWYLDTILDI